jgi:hypothetical protein
MRSEDETRISKLPKLIAEEEDPDQVKILAFEPERLLSGSLFERFSKPPSSAERLRKALRHDERLRRWIHYTALDCSSSEHTKVSLKVNHLTTRTRVHLELLSDHGIPRSGG